MNLLYTSLSKIKKNKTRGKTDTGLIFVKKCFIEYWYRICNIYLNWKYPCLEWHTAYVRERNFNTLFNEFRDSGISSSEPHELCSKFLIIFPISFSVTDDT